MFPVLLGLLKQFPPGIIALISTLQENKNEFNSQLAGRKLLIKLETFATIAPSMACETTR